MEEKSQEKMKEGKKKGNHRPKNDELVDLIDLSAERHYRRREKRLRIIVSPRSSAGQKMNGKESVSV